MLALLRIYSLTRSVGVLTPLRIYSLTETIWDGNFHGKLSTIPYVNSATVPFHFSGANPFDCFKLTATFG